MKTVLLTLTPILLAALLAACDNAGGPPAPGTTPTPAQTPSAGETPEPPNVCQPNPDPPTPGIQVIDQPIPFAAVSSPVTVSGRIAAFEATFKITIYRADGSTLADVTAMSAEGQVLSPFSVDIPFSVSFSIPACIWVYELSARDGSPSKIGQVPLTLLP